MTLRGLLDAGVDWETESEEGMGAVWMSVLTEVWMWRWLSCRVPWRAIVNGVHCGELSPSLTLFWSAEEASIGTEGIRQVRGTSS